MELKAGGYISLSTWSIALAKGSKAAAAKLRKVRGEPMGTRREGGQPMRRAF